MLRRFFRRNDARLSAFAVAVSLMVQGCAYVATMTPDSATGYVEMMSRAMESDVDTWRTMIADVERDYEQSPTPANQVRSGLLLTLPKGSPEDTRDDMERGRELLQGAIDDSSASLTPDVRALVNVRLQELAAREALQRQLQHTEDALRQSESRLRDSEGKLKELLDIENSMENERQQNDGRKR